MLKINAAHKGWIEWIGHFSRRSSNIDTLTKNVEYDIEELTVVELKDLLNRLDCDNCTICLHDRLIVLNRLLTSKEKQEIIKECDNGIKYNLNRLQGAIGRDDRYNDQIKTYLEHKGLSLDLKFN